MDSSAFKKGLRIQLDHKLNIILKGDATANKTNAVLDAYVNIASSFFSMLYWSDHIKNIPGTTFQEFIDTKECQEDRNRDDKRSERKHLRGTVEVTE